MKNSKQIVALATKSDAVIIPKPTKAEVIEALVKAAKAEFNAESEKRQVKIDQIRAEVVAAIVDEQRNWLVDQIGINDFSEGFGKSATLEVTVKLKRTKAITALLKKLGACPSPGYFQESAVRDRIMSVMRADPRRVAALAESPEIKAMLANIQSIRSK